MWIKFLRDCEIGELKYAKGTTLKVTWQVGVDLCREGAALPVRAPRRCAVSDRRVETAVMR